MIDQNLFDYLSTYILRKGEQLDLEHLIHNRFIDIPIIKSTKRTLRRMGMITVGTLYPEDSFLEVDPSLEKLKLTPRKRFQLNDDAIQTLKWIEKGWIIKEYRFKPDGRTLESANYRMGYRLFQQQINRREQEKERLKNELNELNHAIRQVHIPSDSPFIKQKMFENIKQNAISVCHLEPLNDSTILPKTWSMNKRIKFLHFVLAFVQLGSSKDQFDWKEIGATYYQSIGGSKVFDTNQKEFLFHLEKWSDYPIVEFGLTSLGSITPIFFSGPLYGRYSSYEYGRVHATTNLSIQEEVYNTTAKTLWIVENRGILTRLSSQEGFLEKASTFLLCCDGHIRSAHRDLITQLIQASHLNQVMIWTDYDPDGMIIAEELYQLVKNSVSTIKLISPSGRARTNWDCYLEETTKFLKNKRMEQEEMTGDVIRWMKWINN